MNPLTSIPPRVRQVLYVLYALAGLALAILPLYDVDVSREAQVLVIVGTAFGLTAASNMPTFKDVVEGDAPAPDRGESSIVVAAAALVILAVIVWLVLLLVR